MKKLKGLGSFIVGVGMGLIFLFVLGAVYAATVHYVGGGIAQLGEPQADNQSATKAYADSSIGEGSCALKWNFIAKSNSPGSGTICTDCEGWIMRAEVTEAAGSGMYLNILTDGISSGNLGAPGATDYHTMHAYFKNNITYYINVGSGDTLYFYLFYCEK